MKFWRPGFICLSRSEIRLHWDYSASSFESQSSLGQHHFKRHLYYFNRRWVTKIINSLLAIIIFLKESFLLCKKKARGLSWCPECFIWRWHCKILGLQVWLHILSKRITHCGTTWPLSMASLNSYIRYSLTLLSLFPLFLCQYNSISLILADVSLSQNE